MKLADLVLWLDDLLELGKFAKDHSNNGLQVEGRSEVLRIAGGVDACQELFDAAAAANVDLVIVHHGLSWGDEPRRFTGVTANRLRTLLANHISLYAVHLPLDAHLTYGNNAELARIAGAANVVPGCEYCGALIGTLGDFDGKVTVSSLAKTYEKKLKCGAVGFDEVTGERRIGRALFVSGGGGLMALDAARDAGADLLVTGEWTHTMYHYAAEYGIAVIALGHYASETLGIRALLREIRERYGLETEFIDLPTRL